MAQIAAAVTSKKDQTKWPANSCQTLAQVPTVTFSRREKR
jgi:hypothetical protein